MGPDGNVYKTQNGEVFACWDKDDNFNMNLESEFSHEKFNDLKQTKWTFERNFSELRAAKAIIYKDSDNDAERLVGYIFIKSSYLYYFTKFWPVIMISVFVPLIFLLLLRYFTRTRASQVEGIGPGTIRPA